MLLVSTSGDPPNLMTLGFHMFVQHPSLLAVPTADLAGTVVDIGNCSGEDVDKFEHFGLTAAEAGVVAAPLVDECAVNIECRVADTTVVESHNLFLLDAAATWRDPTRRECRTLHHNGDGTFTVDGEHLDLRDRMVLWKRFRD